MKYILTLITVLCTMMCANAQKAVATSENMPTGYVQRIGYYGSYHTEDGILFGTYDNSISSGSARCETLIKFPENKALTEYTIPDGVYCIAKGAFKGNQHITKIRIPSSVVYIGENAFEGCSKLASIEMYESSAVRDIEHDDSESAEVGRYNISGIKVDETEEGVQIILYGNGKAKKIIK